MTLEQFYERLHAIYPEGEYTLVDEYVNISTPIVFRHKCGHEFRISPFHLTSPTYRKGCRSCQHASQVWTHERFEAEMRSAGDGAEEYVALTEYTGYNDPILLLHTPTGAEWETTPNTFLAGGARYHPRRSPRNSSYHRAARYALTDLGYQFEEEKSFPDLKSPFSGRPLWYDFWLPKQRVLLEIDGELHWTPYKERGGIGGEAYLTRRRALDKCKDDWAANQTDLRLLRIRPSKGSSIKLLIEVALRET